MVSGILDGAGDVRTKVGLFRVKYVTDKAATHRLPARSIKKVITFSRGSGNVAPPQSSALVLGVVRNAHSLIVALPLLSEVAVAIMLRSAACADFSVMNI